MSGKFVSRLNECHEHAESHLDGIMFKKQFSEICILILVDISCVYNYLRKENLFWDTLYKNRQCGIWDYFLMNEKSGIFCIAWYK